MPSMHESYLSTPTLPYLDNRICSAFCVAAAAVAVSVPSTSFVHSANLRHSPPINVQGQHNYTHTHSLQQLGVMQFAQLKFYSFLQPFCKDLSQRSDS
jgi:hypothetical protein